MGVRDVFSRVAILPDDVARTIVISLFTAAWLIGVALGVFMMLFPTELMRFIREFNARFNSHIRKEYGPDWLVRTVGLAMTLFGGLVVYHFGKRLGTWP